MEKTLSFLQKTVLYATVFLLPIAFANISPNPFVLPKLVVLVGGVSLALLLWCARTLATGKLEFAKGSFDIPVLVLCGAYLASSILRSTNKMEAYLLPGTATIVIASGVLYFLINQFEKKSGFVYTLLFSGATFALITIFSAFGLFESIPQLPPYMKTGGFTPEGGYLPAILFLIPLLAIGVGNILFNTDYKGKVAGIASSIIIGLGIIAAIWNILPGSKFSPSFPEYGTSWSIAIDAIKNSPILGVGPGDYLTAFNRFRPLSFNETDLWAAKFATASNFYLTVFTEAGLLGISGLLLALFLLYRMTRKYKQNEEEEGKYYRTYPISLGILLVLLIIFPASLLIISLVFILLALASISRTATLNLTAEGSTATVATRLPALLLTLPVIVTTGFILFRGVQVAHAEYTFNKALISLSKNNAQDTIKYLDLAMQENPTVDRYHMTTAQVSILLANVVAQKKDLTDDDRNTIATLIQTAISQAKAGVALNPARAANWDILAQIYRSIMPFAKEADQFAIQTASQAVALDPFNPNLRIALGGIYYAKGDYDNAIRAFETAVAAKKNYPNAYYNLAIAYQQKGDFEKAETAMSQVLAIVDKSTPDYEVAQKALQDIQAKKKEASDKSGQQLTPPKEEPDVIDPKLELPEGSEPPSAPEPSPSITPSPTAAQESTPTQAVTVTPQP